MASKASKDGPYYAVTGIPVYDDADYPKVGVRQNIDKWSDNPDNEKQVNLFVMALDRFQKIDPAKRESFFQVAGIHGQPNVAWDETLSQKEQADIRGKSYCTHNTILFPVWHRPYLALYEQRLYEIMAQDIIPNFPEEEQKEWNDAAYNWRLPFWDWAIANEDSATGTVKVPKLSKYPTITVPTADGKGTERIDNPLFQFKMPNNRPMRDHGVQSFVDPWGSPDELDYGRTIGTSRHPDDEDAGITAIKALNAENKVVRKETEAWKHGVVNNGGVERALSSPHWGQSDKTPEKQKFGKAAEAVYRLLTVPMKYSTFATTAKEAKAEDDDNVTDDLNIEFLHNAIHGFVGGDNYGHMSQIPVASFDPLFWLHHCNIDRIFCLWQGLNPDKWFEEGLVYEFAAQDILGLEIGTKINNETPLRPFHADSKGTYLTAEDVRWTGMLGYTYPEMRTFQPKYHSKGRFDQENFIKDLRTEVNRLYGESRELLLGSDGKIKGVDPVEGGVKTLDYAFSIRYKKYAFGGEPFWVKLYLAKGEEPDIKTDNIMAEVFNFSQKPQLADGQVACENCKDGQENDVWATAYISITPLLTKLIKEGKKDDKNKLTTMKQGEVLQYLRKNAYWRVIKQDGLVAPSFDVEKVNPQIIGSTNDATSWKDMTKAPTLENFQSQPDISGSGPDGGFNPAHKQPAATPPPPVPRIPNARLQLDKTLPFKQSVGPDGVIIIRTSKLDMRKATLKEREIDNTQLTLRDKNNNIVFLISIRRAEGTIHFNTLINNSWGKGEIVSLENRFKTNNPTILVHDQGEGYEVFVDWVHVLWFKKNLNAPAESISYGVNKGQNPVWGKEVEVHVYSSFKEMFTK